MQLTKEQKKVAWIAGIIVGLWVFGPWLLSVARFMVFTPQAPPPLAKPSPMRVAPPSDGVAAALQGQAALDAQVIQLVGSYAGSAVLPDRGFCQLSLQIKRSPDKPQGFTGYSTTACNASLSLTGRSATRENMARDVVNAMTPTSVIMDGIPSNGSIQFTVTRNIGIPVDNCPVTSLTATPYAASQVAAEWKTAGTCKGGQMILRKIA